MAPSTRGKKSSPSTPARSGQALSNEDRTTWVIVAVLAVILGAAFWWTSLRKTGSLATDAVAAPAPAPAVASGGAVAPPNGVAMRGEKLPPDFSLAEIFSGKQVRLTDYLGKVVLVDFWATWCGPCRMELPDFVKLQEKYQGQGFSFIGVSLDQQGPDTVRQFAKAWKMNYPIVVDESGQVSGAYGGIRSIPTSVLVNRDGSVAEVFVGFRDKATFETAIKKALAKGAAKPKPAAAPAIKAVTLQKP